MSSRDGRRLLERVLEHLNYERAICRDDSERLALIEASFTCTEIIRNWFSSRQKPRDRHALCGFRQSDEIARKVAA